MEAVRIGSPSNPMLTTPLYAPSPCEGSGVALPALSLLFIALYAYGLFFSPYSEVFLKATVFAIITVVFGVIG